ncbi:hypothetical protein C5612_04640 [Pseudomonas frederiksbergensis]|uniref:Uncharacterized protein n=1 Tax=Pseudomonas frederiksbergensis TaxID=104087 RepID=A0A2S8HTP8_9PSED|nr:hypothetical protein C5612_04640 [Pseudomonas frederiksbergensis]
MKFGHGAKCGSGLARECGVSFSIDVDWHTAFASKPAPTGMAFDRRNVPGQGLQNGGYLKAKRRPLAAV